MTGDDVFHHGRVIDLRALRPSDVEGMASVFNDTDVMAHLFERFGRTRWTRRDVEARYDELTGLARDGRRKTFVATRCGEDVFLGHCDLMHLGDAPSEAECGIILDKSLWGGGAAAEAICFALGFAFAEMALGRVYFKTDADNVRMQGFFEKHGVARVDDPASPQAVFEARRESWSEIRRSLDAAIARAAG